MKKLILLTSLLFWSLSSFSQQDTATKSVDSIVPLKAPIARLVIKDLLEGDGNKEELEETNKVLSLTQEKIVLKDDIIASLNSKVLNLETIIETKQEQFDLQQELSDKLEIELRVEKTKSFLYKIGTGVGVVASVLLYLQK
jgi:hypothetical protein